MTTLPPPLSVAIVDDSHVVFLGVVALLWPFRHRVRVEEGVGSLLRPGQVDIVLYDPFVPPNTLGRLREISEQTDAPVVVFSPVVDAAQGDDAVTAGAAGILSTRLDGASMVTALEKVAARTTRETVSAPDDTLPSTSAAWLGEREGLSAHEGSIVALIVLGLSNREIAGALHMSLHATETHIRAAYFRMGVASRSEAIAWGITHGFHLTAPSARLSIGDQQ